MCIRDSCNLEREDLILADLADKYGMQINEVSADARAEMAKVAQPAVIKLVAKDIGQDAVDQYMNDVKDCLLYTSIDKLNKQLDDFNVAQATQIFRIKQALMGIALDK